MAVDQELPLLKQSSSSSSSSSTTSSSVIPYANHRPHIQVATSNSATFIQFPRNARQATVFLPVNRPRTSHSSTRLSAYTAETQSLSNQSKISSLDSSEQKRCQSQQRTNPILTNPLLNHRKEQMKSPPIKSSKEYVRTTRLCLSSKPLRTATNETDMPVIRASTAPVIVHTKDSSPNNAEISKQLSISNEIKTCSNYDQQTQYLDDNKFDYITRWLNEVRAATYSKEALLVKAKNIKRRLVP